MTLIPVALQSSSSLSDTVNILPNVFIQVSLSVLQSTLVLNVIFFSIYACGVLLWHAQL